MCVCSELLNSACMQLVLVMSNYAAGLMKYCCCRYLYYRVHMTCDVPLGLDSQLYLIKVYINKSDWIYPKVFGGQRTVDDQ